MKGSIEKRGKNSYRLIVFKGFDLYGKPMGHTKTDIVKTNQKHKQNLQNL